MSHSQPDLNATVDLVLPEPLARRREEFQHAWEDALQGGPVPLLDNFLHGFEESDRLLLRQALDLLENEFQKRLSNLASIPLDGDVSPPAEQTAELPRSGSAGSSGTMDFVHTSQDSAVDSRCGDAASAADGATDATRDFVSPGIEAAAQTRDFET